MKMARKEEGKSDRYAVTTNKPPGRNREAHARVKEGWMEMRGKGKVYRMRRRPVVLVFGGFNFSDCYYLLLLASILWVLVCRQPPSSSSSSLLVLFLPLAAFLVSHLSRHIHPITERHYSIRSNPTRTRTLPTMKSQNAKIQRAR